MEYEFIVRRNSMIFPSSQFRCRRDAKHSKGHFSPEKWPFLFGTRCWYLQVMIKLKKVDTIKCGKEVIVDIKLKQCAKLICSCARDYSDNALCQGVLNLVIHPDSATVSCNDAVVFHNRKML